MHQTIEAEIDADGNVILKEQVLLAEKHRALVIILDAPTKDIEPALLSEQALAEDWDKAEEDEAWKAFQ